MYCNHLCCQAGSKAYEATARQHTSSVQSGRAVHPSQWYRLIQLCDRSRSQIAACVRRIQRVTPAPACGWQVRRGCLPAASAPRRRRPSGGRGGSRAASPGARRSSPSHPGSEDAPITGQRSMEEWRVTTLESKYYVINIIMKMKAFSIFLVEKIINTKY